MEAYVGKNYKGHQKYKPDASECYTSGWMKRISKTEKLVTRNANRSRKKSARQEIKKEIQNMAPYVNWSND
jgi:hypothetical protein